MTDSDSTVRTDDDILRRHLVTYKTLLRRTRGYRADYADEVVPALEALLAEQQRLRDENRRFVNALTEIAAGSTPDAQQIAFRLLAGEEVA